MHLKDNFESGAPISQVPASWFNRVAKFINNLVGGENIEIEKHDDGSASVIAAPNAATVTHDAPEAVFSGAAVGTSTEAARADHVHDLPTDNSLTFNSNGDLGVVVESDGGLTSGSEGLYVSAVGSGGKWMKTDSQGYSSTTEETPVVVPASAGVIYSNGDGETVSVKPIGTGANEVAAGNHNHDDAYAAIDHDHSGEYAALVHGHSGYASSSHTHAYGDGTLTGFGESATKGFDTSGGTMAYDSKIKTLASALSSDGKVKTSSLTCDVSDHQNTCLLIASGTAVTHSGNTMYNMLNAATEQTTKQATKIITDKDAPYIPGADSGKVAVTGTGGKLEASTDTFAKFASAPSGSKLVQTSGTDGTLAELSLGNGLQISSGEISPKFGSSGGITADSNGLKLDSVGSAKTHTTTFVETVGTTTSLHQTIRIHWPMFDANGRFTGFSSTKYTDLFLMPGEPD